MVSCHLWIKLMSHSWLKICYLNGSTLSSFRFFFKHVCVFIQCELLQFSVTYRRMYRYNFGWSHGKEKLESGKPGLSCPESNFTSPSSYYISIMHGMLLFCKLNCPVVYRHILESAGWWHLKGYEQIREPHIASGSLWSPRQCHFSFHLIPPPPMKPSSSPYA